MIDIKLEQSDEMNELKDTKVMRCIHELKNPLNAIYQILNDNELNFEKVQEFTFVELEDMGDMFDNLRAGFKS